MTLIVLKVLYLSLREWKPKTWFLFWFSSRVSVVKSGNLTFNVRTNNWRHKLSDIIMVYRGADEYAICPINEGDIVIDVGAYIGGYSVWAAQKAKFVFAIEPNPDTYKYLEKNVRGIENIKTYKGLLSSEEKDVPLYISTFNPAENSITRKSNYKIYTHSLTLPTIFKKHNSHIPHCDVLKMDCEGAEYDILFNSQDVLHKITRIIMEYHVPEYWDIEGYTVQGLIDMLRSHGYKVNIEKRKCYQGIIYAER
jgi:FkbM family methyltransferase